MSAAVAARAHSNATMSAPARKGRKAPRREAPALARVLRAAARRPGRSVVLALFAAAAMAIILNALVFQRARHPAPLTAAPAPARAAATAPVERGVASTAATPAPVVSPAPRPPARPADLAPSSRETPRPALASAAQPRPAPAPASAPAPRVAAPRDPIADLINAGDLRPPAEIRGAGAAKPAPARRTAEN